MRNTSDTLERRSRTCRPRQLARLGATIGVAATIGLAVAAPVDAAGRRTPGDGSTASTATTSVVREVDRPDDRVALLALTCRPVGGEDDAIGCAWRAPQHPDAAAVRLVRTSAGTDTRSVVYRSTDLSVTTAVDAPVRSGVRYVYRLQALSSSGRIVGISRPDTAGIPADDPSPPAVEPLRLDCSPTSPTRVACDWSTPSTHGVRRLTLWRSVDGGARERLASFPAPFPTSYVDEVPLDASRVRYAVIGENADGRIVARSRADGVVMPSPPTTVNTTPSRPAAPAPTTAAPTPVETRPTETRPVETRPADTAPPARPSTTTTTVPAERGEPVTSSTARPDEPRPDDRTDRVRPER